LTIKKAPPAGRFSNSFYFVFISGAGGTAARVKVPHRLFCIFSVGLVAGLALLAVIFLIAPVIHVVIGSVAGLSVFGVLFLVVVLIHFISPLFLFTHIMFKAEKNIPIFFYNITWRLNFYRSPGAAPGRPVF
jgi:hypothetical protein